MKTMPNNRRQFLRTGLTAAAGLIATPSVRAEEQPKLAKDKFIHSVYFWLKPGLTPAQLELFKKGLHSLTAIETVEHAYIGTPAATDRPIIDHSYSYALILVFKNKPGHDAYQVHPIHEVFRQQGADVCAKILIYDCQ